MKGAPKPPSAAGDAAHDRKVAATRRSGGLTALPVGERSTGHMPRPAAVAADGEERSEIPDDEAPFVAPDIDDEIEPSFSWMRERSTATA